MAVLKHWPMHRARVAFDFEDRSELVCVGRVGDDFLFRKLTERWTEGWERASQSR